MDKEIFRQGMELIAGRDPVFLGAAVAVAAGMALLTGALFVYFRGRRRTGGRAANTRREPASTSAADTYVPSEVGIPVSARAGLGPGDGGSPLDQDLLARLRQTVVRLENLQKDLARGKPLAAESPLKPAPPAVEYVFRKGIG